MALFRNSKRIFLRVNIKLLDLFKLFFDNADANLIGSSIASMSIYILMAIVLIFKPSGLFGERSV